MNYKEALNRCMYLCSKKEYCQSEIVSKLSELEVPESIIAKVLEALITEKFVDDYRFSIAFTHDKFNFNHWGKIKIRFQLKQKKLPSDIIQQALEGINEQEYQRVILEEIKKKKKIVKGQSEFEKKGKIARTIIAKGFEPELVFNLLKMD
ncbi:MAG: regulatory protein RecX [Salinivirgaceae bacterium]